MHTTTEKEYIARINEALVYIDQHLNEDLSLSVVAAVACFSPYHFHRIFRAYTNETLLQYITRKRVETAASVLLKNKSITIGELAHQLGFSSNSSFTKTFKKTYGISPLEFQTSSPDKYSKIGQMERKNGQKLPVFEQYVCNIENHKNWITMNAKMNVKELPAYNLAYVSHTGAFDQIGHAYGQLMNWAGPKGLLYTPNVKTVTVYHDDPSVTEISKVRQSASIVLNEPVATEGIIGQLTTEAGRYVTGNFEITAQEFEMAWQSVFVWINENGFRTDEKDYFEIYHNDFNTHPEKKFIVEICVPIKD